MNVMAQRYLQALRGKCAVDGGVAFADEGAAAMLDDSAGSLRRLDQLLQYARSRALPPEDSFAADRALMNFACAAAVHLGEHIALRLDQDIHWHTREGLLSRLSPDFDLPPAFFTVLTAAIAGRVCLPLGHVQQALFGPQPAPTSESYVEGFVRGVREGQLEENAWASRYLASLEDGSYLPGGLACRTELQGLGLDDSLASLERVDAFLASLRQRETLVYADFVREGPHANLLLLLGYYLASTVARTGHLSLKWVTHDFVQTTASDIALVFETARGCVLDGRLWFPLQTVSGVLFGPPGEPGCADFARKVLAHPPRMPLVALRRPFSDARRLPESLPGEWRRALVELGRAASMHLSMMSGGSVFEDGPSVFIPTFSEPHEEGMRFVSLMDDTIDDAVKEGLRRIEEPTLPFRLLAYDSFANLPTGRIDALCLELRCHGDPPLALTVYVPYRRAAAERPFAVHTPQVLGPLDARLPPEVLAQVFHAGASEIGEFSWDLFLDERL